MILIKVVANRATILWKLLHWTIFNDIFSKFALNDIFAFHQIAGMNKLGVRKFSKMSARSVKNGSSASLCTPLEPYECPLSNETLFKAISRLLRSHGPIFA